MWLSQICLFVWGVVGGGECTQVRQCQCVQTEEQEPALPFSLSREALLFLPLQCYCRLPGQCSTISSLCFPVLHKSAAITATHQYIWLFWLVSGMQLGPSGFFSPPPPSHLPGPKNFLKWCKFSIIIRLDRQSVLGLLDVLQVNIYVLKKVNYNIFLLKRSAQGSKIHCPHIKPKGKAGDHQGAKNGYQRQLTDISMVAGSTYSFKLRCPRMFSVFSDLLLLVAPCPTVLCWWKPVVSGCFI